MIGDWGPIDWAAHVVVAIEIVAAVIIASGLLQNIFYVLQIVFAYRALQRRPPRPLEEPGRHRSMQISTMPISLLSPAYNEELSIVESVRSLLSLEYPHYEVIVINDGSKDGTLERLIEAFGLRPAENLLETSIPHQSVRGVYTSERYTNLRIIDKENGGKADALNAGINAARYPLFCAIDADSILEGGSLRYAVQPFVEQPERTIAVGGTIRVANGCRVSNGRVTDVRLPRRFLPLVQSMEYLRAFLMARLGWSEMGALVLISGAFGIFRRYVAVLCGGYTQGTVGEDFELTVKMHRYMREAGHDYDIRFVPEPVCWTEVPETIGGLQRQRRRWQRGALETIAAHWRMMLNPVYGRVGLLAFLHHLVVDLIGPSLEVLGYLLIPTMYLLGILSVEYLLAFTALTFVFGIGVSVASLFLEEMELRRYPAWGDLLKLAGVSVVENLGTGNSTPPGAFSAQSIICAVPGAGAWRAAAVSEKRDIANLFTLGRAVCEERNARSF